MVVRGMDQVLREADEYFMSVSKVHKTARDLTRRLRDEGIDFAIAGALALNAHGVIRMTEDVDILITREGLDRFKNAWLGRGYIELRPGGKPVRDAETRIKIDFLIAGEFPGDGKPKPVSFPDPKGAAVESDDYPVIALPQFIELKLASGMTAKDRPHDLGDVIRLIRQRSLPREFEAELDPYVQAKYVEMWEAAQNPSGDY